MSARQHQNNQDILRKFIPLNTLSSARFASICDECHVEECEKGTVLFEQGDDAKEFIYLISGMVSLYAGEMEMETIVTGSEVARFAIAHHLPRKVRAVTKSKARIVRIPTHMLDMDSPEDNGQTYLVDEVDDQSGDWMTTMLQSPVFQRLPASNLQKVMMQMEEVAFKPGEIVVKQGDEADFYYIIKSGDCELIRQPSEGSRSVKLGELHSCDAFGEDALLSGNPRNVTVQMKGKGQMLRLSKANFIKLVKEPVLQYVHFQEGQEKVNAGANWLDVRSTDEHVGGHIEGSVNIPFFSLRMKIPELRHDQLQVLVCANGRTSEAAAFLLLKFGFNALILKGGMASWNKSIGGSKASATASLDSSSETVVKELDGPKDSLVKTKDSPSTKQLKEAQNKIMELERLCAQSNEKSNKLELERDELQKKSDHQTDLVAQLQSSSKLVAEELAATHGRNEVRGSEINQELLLEREKNTRLAKELGGKALELNKAKQEMGDFRESMSLLGANISTKNKELEELKLAFNSAKAREEKVAKELNQKLVAAKQEVAELSSSNEMLENSVNASRQKIDGLSQSKAQLEQQNEQFIREKNSGALEKEEQIQLLNSQLSEVRSTLTDAEQSQADLKNHLLEVTAELELARESEKVATEKNKAEAESHRHEFENDLSALTLHLEGKTAELEKHKEEVSILNTELESLKEESQNRDVALSAKDADIDAFTYQLTEAENKLATFNQERLDLESALLEKDALFARLDEKSTSVDVERGVLKEKLEQSDSHLSGLLAEKSALEKQRDESLQSIDELRNKEANFLAEADDLKQQKEQAEKALKASTKELAESNLQVEKLDKESKELHQQVNSAKASLSEVSSGKETLESELMNRLAETQSNLATALTAQQEIEQQLDGETNEKELARQKVAELESSLSEQQQLNQQLSQAHEELNEVRQDSEKEVSHLTESLQQAESRFKEINAASNKLVEEKELGVKEQQQRNDKLENELSSIKEASVGVKQALESAQSENEVVQQELLAVQSQLKGALDEQQETTAELSQVRQKADKAIQEKDAELAKLTKSLEQAQAQLDAAKASLVGQAKHEGDARVQQVTKLESELKAARNLQLSSEDKLVLAHADNDVLKQKIMDVETVLSASTGNQKALLAALDKARVESMEFKQTVELKQSEIDTFVSAKEVMEEELLASKKSLKESSSLAESREQRCVELVNTIEALSSEKKTEGSLFKEQLIELENKCQHAEKGIRILDTNLQTAETNLSIALGEKEKTLVELAELKKAKLSDDDIANSSQQKITELEQLLKQLQEEKEQFIVNADKNENKKVAQLTEQLLAAQNDVESSSKKVSEVMRSRDTDEKEKAELEEKLEVINGKNSDLNQLIIDAERKASKIADSDTNEVRIKELEKQLDDASTMLLDLEIKMESSIADIDEEPAEEEKSGLKALQSELNLVREQTGKDVRAMQVKVENSEKINLALKKKILSMQTLANQEVLPEESPKEKKKGWWK